MPVGILFLIFILTIWNPANLALQAASTLASIETRSTVSIVFLGVRLLITSVGVAAGIALSLRRPGAVWLTKLALALFAIEAIATIVDACGPGQRTSRHAPAAGDLCHRAQRGVVRSIFDYPVASRPLMA